MVERPVFMSAVLVGWLVSLAAAEDSDRVAYYTFDEGSGSILRDHSGHGNDGRLHNARWVRQGTGYCLEFNGVDSYVDCGRGPSLDLREALSVEAWVYPARPVQGEPGILGKHFSSYLLTYYQDGQ
jgi:hypothetical protein